jgi:hypothetical protein
MFQESGTQTKPATGLGVQELVLVDAEELLPSILGAELDMACD